MPMPVSRTVSCTLPLSSGWVPMVILPPSGMASTAFSSRLVRIPFKPLIVPRTCGISSSSSNTSTVTPDSPVSSCHRGLVVLTVSRTISLRSTGS